MSLISTLLELALPAAGAVGLGWPVTKTWRTKRKVEAAVPPRGKFIQISTGKLHYADRGTGPAILMIHGLGGQLGNFDMGLIDLLARDHRVVAIDRPGMGWSERPAHTPANPRAQAAQMIEVIDALGLDRPLIVGHSLGGAIALCLALEHPEKTRGLALLAPLTVATAEPAPPFKPLAIPSGLKRFVLSWTFATPASIRNQQDVFDYIFGPEDVPTGYSVDGGGLLGLRPKSFRNTCRDFLASGRDLKWMSNGYDGLRVPVHILFGREDRILDPQIQGVELTNHHPAIKLTLTYGGHMLPLTQPEACNSFIRTAMADADSATALTA